LRLKSDPALLSNAIEETLRYEPPVVMIPRVALEALFARSPDLRLDDSRQIVWYRNAGNRGPINLHILL
jgi:hypothetical protein